MKPMPPILCLLGLAALGVGLWRWSPSLALVVMGPLLVIIAVAMDRLEAKRKKESSE